MFKDFINDARIWVHELPAYAKSILVACFAVLFLLCVRTLIKQTYKDKPVLKFSTVFAMILVAALSLLVCFA